MKILIGVLLGLAVFAGILGLVFVMTRRGPPAGVVVPQAGAAVHRGGAWDRAFWLRFFWNSALAVLALALLYWGAYESSSWSNPSFAAVNAWMWSHWVVVVLLIGILAAAIAYNAPAVARRPMFTILLIAAAFLFVGTWLLDWADKRVISAPLVSNTKTATGKPSAVRTVVRLAPGQKSEMIPVPPRKRVVAMGDDFLWHQVYENGKEAVFRQGESAPAMGSESMPFVYFENVRKDAQGIELPNALIYHYE